MSVVVDGDDRTLKSVADCDFAGSPSTQILACRSPSLADRQQILSVRRRSSADQASFAFFSLVAVVVLQHRSISLSTGCPKRLFIILNPYGGRNCARHIFADEVKPLLEAVIIHYTLQETKYQLHVQELTHSLDLLRCDGVVCVSGDGVLNEISKFLCTLLEVDFKDITYSDSC